MNQGVWPEVLIGDVRLVLPSLASESVHVVITSPPFWNLRDYNCEGQIGMERTFAEHLDVLAAVFDQVKRVMRKDAVLFINYGDAYACSPNGRKVADIVNDDRTFRDKPANTVGGGFKPKDLMLMPHRLAIRLQEEGWWVRNDIVWAKANPLPESVTDRFTRSHEYVFMLTRSPYYYFDQDAVREQTGSEMTAEEYAERTAPGATWESGGITRHAGANKHDGGKSHPSGRNKRSVFFLPTQPLPFEHYAAFPEALVEPLVLCATSEAGCCPECGAPWRRTVEKQYQSTPQYQQIEDTRFTEGRGRNVTRMGDGVKVQTTGWQPTCTHQQPQQALVPCTVLDIFAGSGTTLRVATRLGRRSIGIELSETYVKDILRKRTAQGGLGL